MILVVVLAAALWLAASVLLVGLAAAASRGDRLAADELARRRGRRGSAWEPPRPAEHGLVARRRRAGH